LGITNDGNYIIAAASQSGISGDKTEDSSFIDPWIIKLDKEPTAALQENQLATINIYPNPTTSKIVIDTQSITTIILYDIRGDRILKTTKKNRLIIPKSKAVHCQNLP
jgi:hypothetical protein